MSRMALSSSESKAKDWHFRPVYSKYGVGTTVFSALAGGLLTGKVLLLFLFSGVSRLTFARLVNAHGNSTMAGTSLQTRGSTSTRISSRTLLRRSANKRAKLSLPKSTNCRSLLKRVRSSLLFST